MQRIPPPPLCTTCKQTKKERNSNLELYRIIVMLLIVAHHYVVNSGLKGSIEASNDFVSSNAMLLFGAWGKVGINCFLLITGYFMCKTAYTPARLLKLYLQVVFYAIVIYTIFCLSGIESLSLNELLWKVWPIKSISTNFTGCFLAFYLFIPFINILVRNMEEAQHRWLVIAIVGVFSILPSFPQIKMEHNYITWFIALYIIASYIRLYGLFPKVTHKQWGWLTIVVVAICSLSVIFMNTIKDHIGFHPYFFVADSNKFLALAASVCSFMWFKDMKIPQSRFINAIGASTFGVLLIHANSDTMRQWLWRDIIDCVGHFGHSLLWTLGYAFASVLLIFAVCAGIDWFRAKYIEPKLLDAIYKKSKTLFNRLQTV